MNPNWNDDFKTAMHRLNTIHGHHFEDKFLKSPMLCFHDDGEYWSYAKFPFAFDSRGFPVMPFPIFRCRAVSDFRPDRMGPPQDEEDREMQMIAYKNKITSTTTKHDLLIFSHSSFRDSKIIVLIRTKETIVNGVVYKNDSTQFCLLRFRPNPDPKIQYECDFWGIDSGGKIEPKNEKTFQWLARIAWDLLSKIAIDTMNPHFHMVKVSPKKNNKTIEWNTVREHLVLIHKNFHINSTSRNPEGHSGHLKRMAHSRRAHYRLLKSEKFKNKKGTLILIRSCWVGPKEWEDGSGQIYRVIERPNVEIQNQKSN